MFVTPKIKSGAFRFMTLILKLAAGHSVFGTVKLPLNWVTLRVKLGFYSWKTVMLPTLSTTGLCHVIIA
jgi:hypothetical protein